VLASFLSQNDVELAHARSGQEGLDRLERDVFDVVLLDVMMPGLDGLEVLRRLRTRASLPVIMLTARGDEADRVVGLELDWRPETQLQIAMRELQWGSSWLEVLLRRRADPKEAETLRLKLALDLVSTLLEQPNLKESTTAFTTELAARLGCDRVTLGMLKGRRITVTAVSHSPQFEKRANLMRAIERAMEEAVDQEETVVHPPEREDHAVVARAHEALLIESQAGSAATFPLVHGAQVVGALTFERAAGHRFDVPTLNVCEAVASVAGPIIELKQSTETSLPVHAGRSAKSLWDKIAGPGYPGWKLGAIGVIALAAFLALATGDFRVSGNAMVEGLVKRAVSAPINGFVREAPLRAGDILREGQLIARLDDRDLRLERVKLQSQRDQYVKQYREAMGKHERAQISIVSAQIAQAEAQLALVEAQLARMALIAPFDGVIVSGDLSQSLGSPVERGQVLFEVAPLKDYRVVLQVDERDIAYAAQGQHGELTVTSMPGERFGFTVQKITPVNTAKEGRNFYRVEAALDAQGEARLRPGMEGVGKITIEERKLGMPGQVGGQLCAEVPAAAGDDNAALEQDRIAVALVVELAANGNAPRQGVRYAGLGIDQPVLQGCRGTENPFQTCRILGAG